MSQMTITLTLVRWRIGMIPHGLPMMGIVPLTGRIVLNDGEDRPRGRGVSSSMTMTMTVMVTGRTALLVCCRLKTVGQILGKIVGMMKSCILGNALPVRLSVDVQ